MITAALLLATISPAAAPIQLDVLPACDPTTEPKQPCSVPIGLTARQISNRLGSRPYVWWVEKDTLNVLAKVGDDGWAQLCCAIQSNLTPIGSSGLAGISVRVPRIDEAILDVAVTTGPTMEPPQTIRGKNAQHAPPEVSQIAGKITTSTFKSASLGETRDVTIYAPPNISPGEKLPVIYLADGATWQFVRIAEASAQQGRSGRVIIVGIRSADGPSYACVWKPCDRRMLEYLPNASPLGTAPNSPFGKHLSFLVDELIPWIERTYPASSSPDDRIVSGYSNGGVWAFSMAALRPDLFGKVLAMSSGNASTIDLSSRLHKGRVFAGAGTLEPTFLGATAKRATLASQAGAAVKFRQIVSGHSPAMWDMLFAEGLEWLVPPAAPPTGTAK